MQPSLCVNLSTSEQAYLLDIARQSIHSGLESGRALQLDVTDFDDNLRIEAAVFITLTRFGDLRGCIGPVRLLMPHFETIVSARSIVQN
jgi:AMMECR1 domain-containing protein